VLGAEQADEVMERAEVIPQTPRGRGASWGDGAQLVADRHDALLDPRQLGARRHPHDVVLLDRSDELCGDGAGLVRSRSLRRDLTEQWRDVLGLAVETAFSGKPRVVGHRRSSPSRQTIRINPGFVSVRRRPFHQRPPRRDRRRQRRRPSGPTKTPTPTSTRKPPQKAAPPLSRSSSPESLRCLLRRRARSIAALDRTRRHTRCRGRGGPSRRGRARPRRRGCASDRRARRPG